MGLWRNCDDPRPLLKGFLVMAIKVRVEGLAEAQAALRQLPDSTAKAVLRRVGRKRLEAVANKARELVPVDKGHLRDSIGVSTMLTRRQRGKHTKYGVDDVEVFAGARKFAGALAHAHLQEFGTERQG